MALQSNGVISIGNIRTELGFSGKLSLGEAIVRALLNRPTGSVSLAHAYGKSATPTAPGTPAFSSITTSSFTVSWTAATTNTAGSISYDVYLNGNFYTNTTATSISVTGRSSSTYYTIQILAKLTLSSTVYSTWGNSAGVTTSTPAPSSPGSPAFSSISASSFRASWNSASNASYYNVYLNGNYYAQTTNTYYDFSGLSANTNYSVYITAVGSGGSTSGGSASVTTAQNPPGQPGNPTFTSITQTSATINWTAASGATSYEVYYWWNSTWTLFATTTNLYAYTSSLSANSSYYWHVRAVNSGGSTWAASYSTLTTLPNAPGIPGTPTYTNVTRGSATLNWAAATGVVNYYYIYMWISGGWYYAGYSTSLSWTHSSLAAGTTYYFFVAAYNAGGTTSGYYSSVTTLA